MILSLTLAPYRLIFQDTEGAIKEVKSAWIARNHKAFLCFRGDIKSGHSGTVLVIKEYERINVPEECPSDIALGMALLTSYKPVNDTDSSMVRSAINLALEYNYKFVLTVYDTSDTGNPMVSLAIKNE